MNEMYSSSPHAHSAIHDFLILPMGLAGTLVWNAKHCVSAIETGKSSIDFYLCINEEGPFSLLEVFPAFLSNPMFGNVYLYTDCQAFESALDQLVLTNSKAAIDVSDYKKLRSESRSRKKMEQALIEIESYQKFSSFYSERGYIPKLRVPKGCDLHAASFYKQIGEDKFVVTTQFPVEDISIPGFKSFNVRGSSFFKEWYEFMKKAEEKFPDVRFVILGKVPDAPMMYLRLSNIIIPRLCGMNLGHEFALLKMSHLFMSFQGGFAPMAIFSDTPYVLTNTKDEGIGQRRPERYPFATENQHLVYETESAPLLLQYLEEEYNEWKKNSRSELLHTKQQETVRTNFLSDIGDELKKELHQYVLEKVQQTSSFSTPNNTAATLSTLNALWDEYSEIADEISLFHSAKALALYRMKRFEEAKKSVDRALELAPDNPSVKDLSRIIVTAQNTETNR